MSRRPPHGRRRPGWRPPNSYKGRPGSPRPAGFTGPGFDQLHRAILPGLAGKARKDHFNALSGVMVLVGGGCGLVLGMAFLGPIGAILGLGGGTAAAGSFARSNRFYRD